MAINLNRPLIKTNVLWEPNTNTAGTRNQIKSGPRCPLRLGPGRGPAPYMIWFEAIEDTSGGFDDRTLAMRAYATTPQGPWTIDPANTWVNTASVGAPDNDEAAPTIVVFDSTRDGIECGRHVGNNTGPRQIAYMRSAGLGSTIGETWTNEPIFLSPQGVGFEADDVADIVGVVKKFPHDGSMLMFYRGVGLGYDGQVGQLTGYRFDTLVRNVGNPVITAGAGGSWNEGGTYSATTWVDPEGTAHVWAVGVNVTRTSQGIGYWRSLDNGSTFPLVGSNPVAAQSGTVGAIDRDGLGDVLEILEDGDILWITAGCVNLTDYAGPTGTPLRGFTALIVPAARDLSVTPLRLKVQRPSKFYCSDGSATFPYTEATFTPGLLARTTFSICGRFRAAQIARTEYREIYTESAAFNLQMYLRITGGGGADAGKLEFFFRIGGVLFTFLSSSVVDTALWTNFLVTRVDNDTWEMYVKVDGGSWALVGSSSVAGGTDATVSVKAIGNWHPSSGEPNEPARMTIADLQIYSQVIDTTAAEAAIMNGTLPSGDAPLLNFPRAGVGYGSDSAPVLNNESALVPLPCPMLM